MYIVTTVLYSTFLRLSIKSLAKIKGLAGRLIKFADSARLALNSYSASQCGSPLADLLALEMVHSASAEHSHFKNHSREFQAGAKQSI